MPRINLSGRTVAYSVRVSKRAKRIIVRCSQDKGLEVVYPTGVQEPTPECLLMEKSDWVLASIEKIRQDSLAYPKREYTDGELCLFRGKELTLKLIHDPSQRRIVVANTDGCIELSFADQSLVADFETRRKCIETFYRKEAERHLPERVRDLADKHGFTYAKVRIKNQKTRWGSCSILGNINLNLRLMMAPDAAIDYVVIHELCHLRVMNHSQKFWTLVESCCSDYRHWRAWFKRHGRQLRL